MTIKEFNLLPLERKAELVKSIIKDYRCDAANNLVFADKSISFFCNKKGEIIKAFADYLPKKFGEKIGDNFCILFCYTDEKSRMKVFYKYGEIEGQEKLN